jgi:hypothetical protein
MSLIQNKTLFSYNDLYSVKNTDTVVSCPQPSCEPSSCNGTTNSDCENCYKKEYCANKQFADELKNHNQKYLGKTVEHSDIKEVYNSEYIKSINLMVGIIGILSFIFYNK